MTNPDIPDDAPDADVVEQRRDLLVDTEDAPTGSGTPLETDPSDWQEQQQIVDDPDDEIR